MNFFTKVVNLSYRLIIKGKTSNQTYGTSFFIHYCHFSGATRREMGKYEKNRIWPSFRSVVVQPSHWNHCSSMFQENRE